MIRFRDVMTRGDWVKLSILLVVAIVAWTWVYIEMQKPILPVEVALISQ